MRYGAFANFISMARAAGELVVQPRMGMCDPKQMRAGLLATKLARATTVGTITLDSFTRTGDLAAVRSALRDGVDLNGYPIVTYGPERTREMLRGICEEGFPVQIRHGSPAPKDIVATLMRAGIDATEGGPVSYCLPYSRTPLRESVLNWARSAEMLSEFRGVGVEPHLETFGGCMLGQLCPPSLLVALSVLEGMFFHQHGLRSISLSYAQQTHAGQDQEALLAMHRLAGELFTDIDWHVVVYTYMGVYPNTERGALRLLGEAAELAVRGGAARLIVKTAAEAHRIPTIAENVQALEYAANVATGTERSDIIGTPPESEIYRQASDLVHAVRELHADIGVALRMAFDRGYLDVPYCLHPDNAGRARTKLTEDGRLVWSRVGAMPIKPPRSGWATTELGSAELLAALSYVARRCDEEAAQLGTLPAAERGQVE
ncbi:methylaspartate mutase [Saccharothrix sp. ALI-22-I]|uniref:methylaspartate mutase n=1 Tax=Saccharothrix sp. ALI-22-I TaxID=1933778 RepID=UPI0023785C7F|nr:methylaspartate mutase [Saccharothrix sp. ALI-22-I]